MIPGATGIMWRPMRGALGKTQWGDSGCHQHGGCGTHRAALPIPLACPVNWQRTQEPANAPHTGFSFSTGDSKQEEPQAWRAAVTESSYRGEAGATCHPTCGSSHPGSAVPVRCWFPWLLPRERHCPALSGMDVAEGPTTAQQRPCVPTNSQYRHRQHQGTRRLGALGCGRSGWGERRLSSSSRWRRPARRERRGLPSLRHNPNRATGQPGGCEPAGEIGLLGQSSSVRAEHSKSAAPGPGCTGTTRSWAEPFMPRPCHVAARRAQAWLWTWCRAIPSTAPGSHHRIAGAAAGPVWFGGVQPRQPLRTGSKARAGAASAGRAPGSEVPGASISPSAFAVARYPLEGSCETPVGAGGRREGAALPRGRAETAHSVRGIQH